MSSEVPASTHPFHMLIIEQYCVNVYIIKKLCCIYTSHEGAVCVIYVSDQPCYFIKQYTSDVTFYILN